MRKNELIKTIKIGLKLRVQSQNKVPEIFEIGFESWSSLLKGVHSYANQDISIASFFYIIR